MRRIFRVSVCFWTLCTSLGLADPAPRTLPAGFAQDLQPQLTAVEPLLQLPPAKDAAATGGEVLLREHIISVDEAGLKTDVAHTVYRATAESGVAAIARDVESFHRKRSRIHLVLARTLQPDGRVLPVRDEAAFIQTPQRSADSDLYDDQAEMVIVYPDVKKDSVVESIVVREETESRIPGHLTLARGFSAGWPVRQDRFILEVPRAQADRLRFTSVGNGVPEPVRQEVRDGSRVRWTWERRNIPAPPREENRVSVLQTGPVIYATTLPDWETFLAWYGPLAEARMGLSDALKAQVDDWTKAAATPLEITDILLRKVASDVRYVGLEFGDGDLVPRDVNATWENQYGDCKDKACLLAAMLRHKGIEACPALINTDFPGRVEKRSPDYRHFDHCITAVKGPDGAWLFCDPTIPGLPPGGIGSADGDREVLLVQPGGAASWARTPPHDFGLIRHRMDLQMDAAGGLSGWTAIETDGFNAARYAGREAKATPDSLRNALQSQLANLSEGLSAVDVRKHPQPAAGTYRVDAYILIPGNGAGAVPFLADEGYIPRTGNEESRETPYESWQEVYEAEARITLPAGLAPAGLPEPLDSKSPWADARGSWEWQEGVLTSRFRFHAKVTIIPPADFPAFSRQMRAVHAWTGRELPLREGNAPAAPAAPLDAMETLPHLPTVDGQLLLVDNKYPLSGNGALRRAALEKSIRYFPGDQAMLYRAGSSLAWLEIRAGDPAAGLKRLDGFQESCRAHVDADDAALGDYFRAHALKDLGRTEEALVLYRKMAGDGALNAFRRTWSSWQATRLLEETAPAEALAVCEAGMALQDADSEPALYPLWAKLMLRAERGAEVENTLRKLAADRAQAAPAILTTLAEQAAGLPDGLAPVLLEVLARTGPPEVFGQGFVKALTEAKTEVQAKASGDLIRQRLTAWLKDYPDSSADAKLPEGVKTASDMEQALASQLDSEVPDIEAAVKLGIGSILEAPPGTPLSTALLNLIKAVNHRERHAPDPSRISPLLEGLTGIARALPPSDDTHHEGFYFLAQMHQRRGQLARMKEAARLMIDGADEGRDWIAIAPLGLLLNAASEAGDLDEVLKLCQEMRRYPSSAFLNDTIFREAVAQVLNGNFDQALACLDELAAKPETELKGMTFQEQAGALLKFVGNNREAAVKWWRDSAQWWPAMLDAARKIHGEATPGLLPLPLIASAEASGQTASGAALKKDFAPVAAWVLRLAGAGRLDPAYLAAYGGLCSQSDSVNLQDAKTELCQSLCAVAPFIPSGPFEGLLVLYCEEAWFRLAKWEETAAAAKRYFALNLPPDALSGYAARYWAVAAEQTKKDYPELAAIFKKLLDAKADPGERPRNLWLYAHLLTLERKEEEARILVRTELESGQLQADHEMMPQLQAMADRLDRSRTLNRQEIDGIRAAVEGWIKVAAPAWLDSAFPASLTDPALKDPRKWMEDNQTTRPASAVKTAVLILRDPAQPQTVREDAVLTFLSWAPVLGSGPAGQQAEWEAIFNHPGIDESLRTIWLTVQLAKFAHLGWPNRIKPWLDHPLLAKAEPRLKTSVAHVRQLTAINPADGQALKTYALGLLKEEPELALVPDFATALGWLMRADPTAAAECLEAFKAVQFTGEAAGAAETAILEATAQLASAKALAPIHAALRQALDRHFPQTIDAPGPTEVLAGETPYPLTALDDAGHRRLLTWHLRNGVFPRHSLETWEQLITTLDPQGKDQAIKADLAQAALRAADTDEAASAAIGLMNYCLDIDDEAQRQQLTTLLKPFAAKTDWTETADWLTFIEAIITLRTGAGTDAREAINAIDNRLLKSRLIRMQIGTLMASQQTARLKKFLAGTPSVSLLSPGCLPVSLGAWRSLGMKDEAAVAEARQQSAIRLALEGAWAARDISGIDYALRLVMDTGFKELIPPGLEEDLPKWVAHPTELNDALFFLASLRGDWATAARRGSKVIGDQPTRYSAYVHVAKACAMANQPDEARKLLRTYLEKTHDEPQVPEAGKLLESLEAPAPAPQTPADPEPAKN